MNVPDWLRSSLRVLGALAFGLLGGWLVYALLGRLLLLAFAKTELFSYVSVQATTPWIAIPLGIAAGAAWGGRPSRSSA